MTTDVDQSLDATLRVVDCHSHLLPPAYVSRLTELSQSDSALTAARNAASPEGKSRLPSSCSEHLLGSLGDRLQVLAASGVDCQVLSAGSALAFPAQTTHRAELVSVWNDAVHDEIVATARPSAFRVFASVPLPDIAAAIRETQRVATRETTVGFSINAHILGTALDAEQWRPLLSVWNDMDATVFVHPDRFRTRGLMPGHLEVDAGTQFDDTLATLQVTGPQIRSLFPRIRWVIAHLGGAFTFLLERLDEHWERDKQLRPGSRRPSEALDNVWFDTAGHGESAIRFAVDALGPERFIFGSDFPMLGERHLERAAGQVRVAAGEESLAELILSRNVTKVLPRLALCGGVGHG